jgi:hypothetical protein
MGGSYGLGMLMVGVLGTAYGSAWLGLVRVRRHRLSIDCDYRRPMTYGKLS